MHLDRNKLLTEAEAGALLRYLKDRTSRSEGPGRVTAQLDQLIVTALLLSGLRNSEFCALTVGNTIVGTRGSVFAVRGGSARGRTVHVPQRVSRLVQSYVDDVRPRFLPVGVDPGDHSQPLVFNEHRRPYERTGLYRRVVRILTAAGLGDRASVQLLRHTYGYLAYLRTGGNLLFVQRQLGHSHPRITSVYAQFVDESYSEMAERVAAFEPIVQAADIGAYARRRPEFDCEID